MTLCVTTRIGGLPILVSDFLVTSTGTISSFESPLFPEIGRVAHRPDGSKVIGFARKTLLVHKDLLISAAGSLESISSVFSRLSILYGQFAPASLQNLVRGLAILSESQSLSCEIVGWLVVGSEAVGFRWNSSNPDSIASGDDHVIGSGQRLFEDLKLPHEQIKLDAARRIEGAFSAVLRDVGTLVVNELIYGNTLSEAFGGGYEIFCHTAEGFEQLDNVAYLIFSIKLLPDDTIRVGRVPILVNSIVIGEEIICRTVIPKNWIGVPSDEKERIAIARKLVSGQAILDIPAKSLPLSAKRYVVACVGSAVNGENEVYTAVVCGEEAQQFKIYLTGVAKDEKEEIRFELPQHIMLNIIQQAFLSFSRQTSADILSKVNDR